MYPELFSLGPLVVKTFNIFLVLGLVVAAFIFWRKGREEHYEEDQLFDGFLTSLVVGFIWARTGFIFLHPSLFGWNVAQWIDVFGSPGLSGVVGVLAASIYMYRFAKQKKWDVFEVLDFWTLALCGSLIFISLGSFFDGIGVGTATQLPWGMQFPGLLERHHPVPLYAALFYSGLFWYLSWAEYRYRTFEWYRATKKAAQTGFLVCVFLIVASLFAVITTFIQQPVVELFEINVDRIVALASLFVGVLLLYSRSGRTIGIFQKKKKGLFA